VRLEAGPPGDLEPAAAIFAWAETEAVAAERLRGRAGAGAADPPAGDGVVADLVGLLWSAPAPSAAAAARANDKTFSLAAQDSLGLAIPGSRIIASPAELRAHLESGGTDASPRRRWVLKAPFSAAGRLRVRGEGSAVAAADAKRIDRLLALQGLLVFEPWLERTAEFGCAAIAREDAVEVIGIHGIETSARGGFRAASIPPPGDLPAGLTSGEENLIAGVARRVGERLAAAGYRGPFGIDCWKHVEASGEERLHLLGEINARMTFGMVARVLAARLRAARVLTPGARARLVADPGGSGPAPAAGSIPIVLGAGGRPSLWIEG
jgi:hypothetical protein